MLKLIKARAFIILFAALLFTPEISTAQFDFPSLNNSVVFENGKKGVDVSISSWSDRYNWRKKSASLDLANFLVIGAKINDVADLKNINFYASLASGYNIDYKSPGKPHIKLLSVLDFKSSNQIKTYVDWIKLGYGIGKFLGADNDPRKHIFIYSGLGFTKAAFNDAISDFKNMTFSGVKPFIGLQFRIGNDNLNLSSQSEIKAIVWDKTLYEINPKIELSYDVLSLMDRRLFHFDPMLIIRFSAEYSKLLYNNLKNDYFKYSIGLSYTLGKYRSMCGTPYCIEDED